MTDSLDKMIECYGPLHLWTPWHRWVNFWRLLTEHVEIRVILDVALRCPDEALRKQALDKLRGEFHAERLDMTWPGKDCFTYDWEELIHLRDEHAVAR